MAEQEIAKHGKNVIHLMTKKEHTFAHRLREIAIEVATIVFAVSMSIWLHGLSEHYHQQKEVKAFLVGLKEDLTADIGQLEDTKRSYHGYDANYAYLASLDPKQAPDAKKFENAFFNIGTNWFFIPTKSRYDGFQISGKLSNIEDEKLLAEILDLYQSMLQQVRNSENGWLSRQHKLLDYIDENLEGDDPTSKLRFITSPKAKRLLGQMMTVPQQYQRYQSYINESRDIIKKIDAAYPEPAHAKPR